MSWKTLLVLSARGINPKKVDAAPKNILEPIVDIVSCIRSRRVPLHS